MAVIDLQGTGIPLIVGVNRPFARVTGGMTYQGPGGFAVDLTIGVRQGGQWVYLERVGGLDGRWLPATLIPIDIPMDRGLYLNLLSGVTPAEGLADGVLLVIRSRGTPIPFEVWNNPANWIAEVIVHDALTLQLVPEEQLTGLPTIEFTVA